MVGWPGLYSNWATRRVWWSFSKTALITFHRAQTGIGGLRYMGTPFAILESWIARSWYSGE